MLKGVICLVIKLLFKFSFFFLFFHFLPQVDKLPFLVSANTIITAPEGYEIEYTVKCANNYLSYSEAGDSCSRLGIEWMIATVSSSVSNDAITSILPALTKTENTWLGAKSKWSGGYKFFWKQTPRNKIDIPFSDFQNCLPGMYCNFANGNPGETYCNSFMTSNLVMVHNGTWLNVPDSTRSDCNAAKCYACQRFPCSSFDLNVSCAGGSVLNVSGYFPNCKCICKTGYSGANCKGRVVNNGNYSSTYLVKCGHKSMNYSDAQAQCKAMLDGWDLGTITSLNGSVAVKEMIPSGNITWLAGSDAENAGIWKWMTGRQAGKQFSQGATQISGMYINWGTGRPRPSESCEAQKRNYLTVESDGTWSDQYNATNTCDTTPNCFLCEKSSCVLEEDCDVKNSINVTGNYGSCACICRTGWTGQRCNLSSILYTSTYSVEYKVGCDFFALTQSAAQIKCNSFGDEWSLATAYSNETNEKIKGLISYDSWLGANYIYDTEINTYFFKWQFGRYKDLLIADSSFCLDKIYCNFAPDHPLWNFCDSVNYFIRISPNGFWYDVSSTTVSTCVTTRCYVCERSHCNISADCFKTGSLNASGYYPNCTCICKSGFIGSTCNLTFANNGDFLSEYIVACSVNLSTFSEAISHCNKVGTGWNLATVPNAKANLAIVLFGNESKWLGGSSNGTPGSWAWLSGRLNGNLFYKINETNGTNYSNWADGRPKDETCGTDKREYLSISNDGTWMDAYAEPNTCQGVPALPKCYACERQPCSVSLDCNNTNTLNVTGYYPYCKCDCKNGWSGKRCDINITVDNGGYFSEYKVICKDLPFFYDSSSQQCSNFGPGWTVASVPTKAANDLISILTDEDVWIGANKGTRIKFPGYTGRQWYWETDVRAKRHFATLSSCLNNTYCNFKPGESLDQRCDRYRTFRLVINGTLSSPSNRYWAFTDGVGQCVNPPKCVACERSPCSVSLDCASSTNVEVADGYFPNCKCQCKWGFVGNFCNITSLINVGKYNSSFDVLCNTSALSFEDLKNKCSSLGNGWDLATVPNYDANVLMSSFSPNEDIWLAGSLEVITNEWKWLTGRMEGITFYANSSCLSSTFCDWSSNEPSSDEISCYYVGKKVKKNKLLMSLGSGIRKWKAAYENAQCESSNPHKCYACERSLCVVVLDCNSNNTVDVKGYFPLCTCVCKDGYAGSRCENRLCTNGDDCHGRATSVSGVYPNCTCSGCPYGYRTDDCSPNNVTHSPSYTVSPIPGPTTTIDPNRTCPFNVTSCVKDEQLSMTLLYPMYNSDISLNGLRSVANTGIKLVLPLTYYVTTRRYTYNLSLTRKFGNLSKELYIKDTYVRNNAIIAEIVPNVQNITEDSPLYLQILSSSELIEHCCHLANRYLYSGNVNETLIIGEVRLLPYVPTPDRNNISTFVNVDEEKKISGGSSLNERSTCCTELLGSHTDHVVLRALSPLALMVTTNDNGYSGIIISNLIFIAVITVIHFIFVVVHRFRSNCTIREACAKVSFPSMPIYVVYALLPGTAVATGEVLTVSENGVGFVGLVFFLGVLIGSGLVPYLLLSRSLSEVALFPGFIRSRVELLFPTVIFAPFETNCMYMGLIGNMRNSNPIWPTLPVWSAVLLFVAALIHPCTRSGCIALYVILAVLHFVIIIIVALFRPMTSLSLNVLFMLGLIPLMFLCVSLASSVGTESFATSNASRVLLILLTVVTASRLAVAVASPLKVFQLASYRNITRKAQNSGFSLDSYHLRESVEGSKNLNSHLYDCIDEEFVMSEHDESNDFFEDNSDRSNSRDML